MVTRPSLLPANATATERTLEAALQLHESLFAESDQLRLIRINRPLSLAPELAAEWSLAQFYSYFNDYPALFTAGLPWLKKRGTSLAVTEALGFVDTDASHFVRDWNLYLNLTSPPLDIAHIQRILHVTRASIPAHIRLYKLFVGVDVRAMTWDTTGWDNSAWDDEPGAVFDGVKLSFWLKQVSAAAIARTDFYHALTAQYDQHSTRTWALGGWDNTTWRHTASSNTYSETI